MSEQPDLSTLPKRMRYTATVLREADKRYGVKCSFSPDELETLADQWEAVDDREGDIEDLALFLNSMNKSTLDYNRDTARILIDNGWRKGDPA